MSKCTDYVRDGKLTPQLCWWWWWGCSKTPRLCYSKADSAKT